MLFSFAVRDRAKLWLDSQLKESLDTWDKEKGVLEVETLDAILAQKKAMSQQINMLTQNLSGIASIKNLEIQMGQLATKVNKIDQRTTNSLHGNTISNVREECKAITLISGQVASTEAQVTEEPVEKEALTTRKSRSWSRSSVLVGADVSGRCVAAEAGVSDLWD
ncbi:hypothetical protein AHAS_Ahas09G0196600 [Arachis hypogaea]